MKRLGVGGTVFVGLVIVVVILVGGIAAYEHYALRDFRTWDTNGPAPLSTTAYYAHGDRITEIMVTTVPGTKLADLADMSIFGNEVPGLSNDAFENRHGASRVHIGGMTVEPFREIDSSTFGQIERWVLHARPELKQVPIERFFRREIADLVSRAKLTGSVHIHNGSSTGFLTCDVYDGRTIGLVRWHGAA